MQRIVLTLQKLVGETPEAAILLRRAVHGGRTRPDVHGTQGWPRQINAGPQPIRVAANADMRAETARGRDGGSATPWIHSTRGGVSGFWENVVW
jgi:hypothetical protein